MLPLAQETVNQLLERLERLEGLEAILRLPIMPFEYAEPLFSLKLDVFLRDHLPSRSERKALMEGARHFEASRRKPKDRFFWQKVPVHVEYKLCSQWEELLETLEKSHYHWDGSTYPLFRVTEGIVLWDRSGWVKRQKERLLSLPFQFYEIHLTYLRDRLEHLLSDLRIAYHARDRLMYQMTLGRFLETLVEAWFTQNRSFMPPFDQIQARLRELEDLPEGALGILDVLTRDDVDWERRLEVAQKATQGVI